MDAYTFPKGSVKVRILLRVLKDITKKFMDKNLQNLAWSCLPKEFKEEVKKYYDNPIALGATAVLLLENLFGVHNLTSDAEGEEMLTVLKREVRSIYDNAVELIAKYPTDSDTNRMAMLTKVLMEELFGSKCLPDDVNEPLLIK